MQQFDHGNVIGSVLVTKIIVHVVPQSEDTLYFERRSTPILVAFPSPKKHCLPFDRQVLTNYVTIDTSRAETFDVRIAGKRVSANNLTRTVVIIPPEEYLWNFELSSSVYGC